LSNKKTKAKPKTRPRLSKIRRADPWLEREQETYEFPLPSREYTLSLLTEQAVPLPFDDVCELLDIEDEEREFFQRRLGAMARDGQLMQDRLGNWLIPDKANLIPGRVQGHPDGFGFLVPEEGGDDLFLSAKEMEKVLHGDRAIARIIGVDRKGRPEGKIVEVTERANKSLVGRVFCEHGVWFAVAENRRISQDILLAPAGKGKPAIKFQSGQVVVIEIVEQPSKHSQPIGRVSRCWAITPTRAWKSRLPCASTSCRSSFRARRWREAKKLPDRGAQVRLERTRRHPPAAAGDHRRRNRQGFRRCRVLRDARARGFRLVVAIADVSATMSAERIPARRKCLRARQLGVLPAPRDPDAAGEAVQRPVFAQSADRAPVHGVRHVDRRHGVPSALPFLPCGDVLACAADLYRSGRGALRQEAGTARRSSRSCCRIWKTWMRCSACCCKARHKRGAIDFDTVETRMVFDDQGKIERIVPV
jgi:ribonuclease R